MSAATKCIVCGARIGGAFKGQPFHSQACARVLLLRILESVPGVVDLLPPKWRGDIAPVKSRSRFSSTPPAPHRMADRARDAS